MGCQRIGFKRLVLSAVGAAMLCIVAMPGSGGAAAQDKEAGRGWKIEPGMEVQIAARSPLVEWGGNEYWLVSFGGARFELDGTHLTAVLRGAVTTFDDVTYDVSCAVYDAERRLLGVARGEVIVPRIWAGVTGMTPRDLRLDFGESLDFDKAAWFELSISREKVLTPDDWQKEGK